MADTKYAQVMAGVTLADARARADELGVTGLVYASPRSIRSMDGRPLEGFTMTPALERLLEEGHRGAAFLIAALARSLAKTPLERRVRLASVIGGGA